MKLKAFDFDDMLYESEKYNRKTMHDEIEEKLKPYVLYFIKNDSIGICLEDKKKDIIRILKEYGQIRLLGNFVNINTFLCSGDYGWDYIQLGNYELDGEEVWVKFGKLLKEKEQILIDAKDNFEVEWNKLQKLAIKNVWNVIVKDTMKELEYAEKDLEERVGMYK